MIEPVNIMGLSIMLIHNFVMLSVVIVLTVVMSLIIQIIFGNSYLGHNDITVIDRKNNLKLNRFNFYCCYYHYERHFGKGKFVKNFTKKAREEKDVIKFVKNIMSLLGNGKVIRNANIKNGIQFDFSLFFINYKLNRFNRKNGKIRLDSNMISIIKEVMANVKKYGNILHGNKSRTSRAEFLAIEKILRLYFKVYRLNVNGFFYEGLKKNKKKAYRKPYVYINSGKDMHNLKLEILGTLIPMLILVVLAIPSLIIIYSFEEYGNPELTFKIIANQWYGTYEHFNIYDIRLKPLDFSEIEKCKVNDKAYGEKMEQENELRKQVNLRKVQQHAIDSHMIDEGDLNKGDLRLLEVDKGLIIPEKTIIRFLVTSNDVIHSFAVPAFGMKVDAVPGRLNEVVTSINRTGIYMGQCSELCGVNHGFMPINVQVVNRTVYEHLVGYFEDDDKVRDEITRQLIFLRKELHERLIREQIEKSSVKKQIKAMEAGYAYGAVLHECRGYADIMEEMIAVVNSRDPYAQSREFMIDGMGKQKRSGDCVARAERLKYRAFRSTERYYRFKYKVNDEETLIKGKEEKKRLKEEENSRSRGSSSGGGGGSNIKKALYIIYKHSGLEGLLKKLGF